MFCIVIQTKLHKLKAFIIEVVYTQHCNTWFHQQAWGGKGQTGIIQTLNTCTFCVFIAVHT